MTSSTGDNGSSSGVSNTQSRAGNGDPSARASVREKRWAAERRRRAHPETGLTPDKCGYWGNVTRRTYVPCGYSVSPGMKVCRQHASMGHARAKQLSEVYRVIRQFGFTDEDVDPGKTLLQLVSQSSARVRFLASLLEESYEAAERLRAASENAGEADQVLRESLERVLADASDADSAAGEERAERARVAVQRASEDLRRILTAGGVTALVGSVYASTPGGQVYAGREEIRALVRLESDERDRCAKLCALALTAGIAERQVKMAETQGRETAWVFRRILDKLDLTPEQLARVPEVMSRELALLVPLTPAIEGVISGDSGTGGGAS